MTRLQDVNTKENTKENTGIIQVQITCGTLVNENHNSFSLMDHIPKLRSSFFSDHIPKLRSSEKKNENKIRRIQKCIHTYVFVCL